MTRITTWITTWTRRKTVAGIAAAVAVAVLATCLALALGSSGAKPVAHKVAAPAPPPRPKPKPKPKPCSPPGQSPFTGEPVKSPGPVLAVKIDNIVYARPQTGLTKADIIYVLPVEGGLTRFLAIFSSHFPPVIGPVRSARQDDIQLLRQFGRPAFAFSGAQPNLLPVVERARIVNLYAGVVGGYYRNDNRIAPYNLYAHTRVLLREARGRESRARCIGFQFGPPPKGGHRTKSVSVSYPAASYRFTWSARDKRWLVWIDGSRGATTEGPQLSAATVVIQHTDVTTSVFKEEGLRPPYAQTTGHGWALVLRNGLAYRVRWSRLHENGGTTFTLDGKPFTFARGQVWIVLTGNRHNESQ
jgi:Protein of unknown function (DUF3048) N-terminal domain/Protein of unknown function (DUF3048) C-terminal domain